MRMRTTGWPVALLALSMVAPTTGAADRESQDSPAGAGYQSPLRQRIEAAGPQTGAGRLARMAAAAHVPGALSRTEAECEGTPSILDGNFETAPRPSLGRSTVYGYGEWIHGAWYVTEGTVELHRFKAGRNGIPQGTVLELNGDSPGAVSQELTGLTPDAPHVLTFDYAVPPGEDEATILVNIEGDDWELETSADALGEWDTAYLEFYPTSSTAELQILAYSGDDVGVIVDGFAISCGSLPTLADPGAQYNTEGDDVFLQLVGEGIGELAYFADGLPPGLSLDEETGLISGTIDEFGAGNYWVELLIADDEDDHYAYIQWHVRSQNGLVASWSFSEGSGEETEDTSGYENIGYLSEGAEWIGAVDGTGIRGMGDEIVWVEPSPSLTPHDEYSFAGWVRGGNADEYYSFSMIAFKGIFELYARGGDPFSWEYYFLQYEDVMEGGFLLYNEEFDEYEWGWVFAEDLPVNQWYHLALTTNGHGFTVYVNGELSMEYEWPEGWVLAAEGGPLQLGGLLDYDFEEVGTCDLDEIRIYDRVITPAEIAELADAIGPFHVENPGDQTNEVGDEVDLTIQATGGIDRFWTSGLPPALEMNELTGRITGEFEFCDAGSYEVFVEVEGTNGESEEIFFLWAVHPPDGGLVPNHSFENGTPVPEGDYVRFEQDDIIYDSWYVESGSVDLHNVEHYGVGDGLDASAGAQVLDLNGGGPGRVSVEIEGLVPGEDYVIRLRCAKHPGRVASSGHLWLDDADYGWSLDVGPGSAPRGQRWVQKQFVFEAAGTSDVLFFESLDSGPYGLLIDEVEVLCSGPIHEREDIRLPSQPSSSYEPTRATQLLLNRPNPFSSSTQIRYDLGTATSVQVSVFSVDGRKVRTLVDRVEAAGSKSIEWDGKDDAGHPVGSGTYLLQFHGGALEQTQRLVKIR